MDRVEHRIDDWDKLFRGMESTISLILKVQGVMKSDISVLKEDVSTLKDDVSILKQDVNLLALGQIKINGNHQSH